MPVHSEACKFMHHAIRWYVITPQNRKKHRMKTGKWQLLLLSNPYQKNSNLPLMVVPHFLWSMMLSDKLEEGKSINVHQLKTEEHMQFTCWPCSWATHDAASSQRKSFLDWQQQQQRLLLLLHSTRCHSAACTGVLSVPAPPHLESLCHLGRPVHTPSTQHCIRYFYPSSNYPSRTLTANTEVFITCTYTNMGPGTGSWHKGCGVPSLRS